MNNNANKLMLGLGGTTQLLTQRGEIGVAQLRPGDEAAALMLTGFVRIAATSPVEATGPAVRLQQDAIGPNQPRRDTIVAADTLLVLSEAADGPVLARAGSLVNAANITRLRDQAPELWRLELEQPDHASGAAVVLLDGLRAATGADVEVPLASAGQLQTWRARLRMRAQSQGATPAVHQDIHLQVNGARLDPERHLDGTWVFSVPDAAATIHLRSASGVPAEMDVTSDDERLLGVGVGSLVFNGQPIALEDARLGTGWHGMETQDDIAWRWTDGDAALEVFGPGRLAVGVVRVMHVWATAATSEPLPPELERSAPMPPPDAAAASVEAALPEPANNDGKPLVGQPKAARAAKQARDRRF